MALPLFRCTACCSFFSFISRNNGCSRPCVYAVCVLSCLFACVCVSFSRSEYPLRHFAFLSHFASLLPLRTAQPKPPTSYFPFDTSSSSSPSCLAPRVFPLRKHSTRIPELQDTAMVTRFRYSLCFSFRVPASYLALRYHAPVAQDDQTGE